MKRQNLQTVGIEEGEESQINGIDQIFNKVINKSFHNPRKDALF